MKPNTSTRLTIAVGLAIAASCLNGCAKDDGTGDCAIAVTNETSGSMLDIGTVSGRGDEVAQSFVPTSNMTMKTARIRLIRTGSPAGSLTLHLQSDATGKPSGTDLATATASLQSGSNPTISTTATFYPLALSVPVQLTQNTKYWLRLQSTYTSASTSDKISWPANSAKIYASNASMFETTTPNVWATKDSGVDLTDWTLLFQVCE